MKFKVSSMNPVRSLSAARGQWGFSAIEVTAVAAIICVLALILVPAVNKRVDEAKIAAANDDLVAIQKAEELAYGYTGHYWRLCDLDRPTPEVQDPANTTSQLTVPNVYWNGLLKNKNETSYLISNWKGPFLTMHRSVPVKDLVQARPELFSTVGYSTAAGNEGLGGPIFLYFALDDKNWKFPTGGAIAGKASDNTPESMLLQYPVDPWGNPYIFFGSGSYGSDVPALAPDCKLDKQNNWGTAAVYCLGPDGYAGSLATTDQTNKVNPLAYFREMWTIGTGDDLKREF